MGNDNLSNLCHKRLLTVGAYRLTLCLQEIFAVCLFVCLFVYLFVCLFFKLNFCFSELAFCFAFGK